MRFEGILLLFVVIVVVVALVRTLWPLLVIYLLYILIRSLFFPTNMTNTRTYTQDTNYESPKRKVSGDVIDADFETREVDE